MLSPARSALRERWAEAMVVLFFTSTGCDLPATVRKSPNFPPLLPPRGLFTVLPPLATEIDRRIALCVATAGGMHPLLTPMALDLKKDVVLILCVPANL